MQIEIKEISKLGREITVTIPKDVVEQKFNAKCEEVAKTIKMDGFRPGKVPADIVKKQYGEKVFHELEGELINEGMAQAIDENSLTIAGTTGIDHDHKHEVADFTFTAKVDLFPQFEPKGLDKIKLTRETAEPSDEMMDEAMADLQKRLQSFAEKDGAAEKGDRVTVTGQGYVKDGKEETAFEGGNLADFPIELGSGSLIPGFEEQLEGAKVGDKKDVNVKFPDEYHSAELAGKDSVFKLEITKIEGSVQEELNDEFAQKLGQESLEELKNAVKGGMTKDLEAATTQRLKRTLFDHLDSKNSFDIPESLVEREIQSLLQGQINELARQGLTPDQVGMSFDKMKEDMKELGERRVKLGLLLAEIAKVKEVKITEEDIRKAVLDQVERAGPQQAEQVRNYFADPKNRQQLAGPLLEEKVTELLLADAAVEEKAVDAKELMKEFQ